MSFGVLAIDVRCRTVDLGRRLRGTATKFAPHVTIVPRMPRERLGAAAEALARWLGGAGSPAIALRGPRWVERDLAWYECRPGEGGWSWLREAHEVAMSILSDADPAQAPNTRHVGLGYRPHLTVAWHCPATALADLPARLIVHPVELAMYSYHREAKTSCVRRRPLTRVRQTSGIR